MELCVDNGSILTQPDLKPYWTRWEIFSSSSQRKLIPATQILQEGLSTQILGYIGL